MDGGTNFWAGIVSALLLVPSSFLSLLIQTCHRYLERVLADLRNISRRGFWQQFFRRASYAAILERHVHDVNQAMVRFSARSVLALATV